MEYHFNLPVNIDNIQKLKAGDILYVSGEIFTARDEAHHKMLNMEKNKKIYFRCPYN